MASAGPNLTYADRVRAPAGQAKQTTARRQQGRLPAQLSNDQRREAFQKIVEGVQALQISSVPELQEVLDAARKGAPILKPPPSPATICIYDLETTGLGKTQEIGIVELGAIVVAYRGSGGWQEVASFHRLW